MADQQPRSPISLPSINEMYPEHLLMQNVYHDHRSSNPTPAEGAHGYTAHLRPFSAGSASTPHGPTISHPPRPSSLIINHGRTSDPRSTPVSHTFRNAHVSGVRHDPYSGPHAFYPAESFPSSAAVRGPRTSPSAPYSFDVLRPHPLTSNLENVASSTNAAVPPRIPHSGALGYLYSPSTPESTVASIQKARPTFRVQLPPPPSASPSASPISATLSQPDATRDGRTSQHMFAGTYFASSVVPTAAQNNQPAPPQTAVSSLFGEEKKHCCPHCNKRFNRPSSLNIHVNTHTGAKPFQCPFPGCNRKFNVNSNMRRHWRNHINARKRDDMPQLTSPSMSSSPSLAHSSTSSPSSPHDQRLPSPSSLYSSQFPSPQSPYFSDSEDEDAAMSSYPIKPEAAEAPAGWSADSWPRHESCRLRSVSSPVPPHSDGDMRYAYPASTSRTRSHSCGVAGCACQPISTALRPAFPGPGSLP